MLPKFFDGSVDTQEAGKNALSKVDAGRACFKGFCFWHSTSRTTFGK
jgi:hypothetical protein